MTIIRLALLCEPLLTIGPANPRPVSDKMILIYSPALRQKGENTILPSTALGETLFNEFNQIIQKHSDKSPWHSNDKGSCGKYA